MVDGIRGNNGTSTNIDAAETRNGPLKDELVRQIIRHRLIEVERDCLWKVKSPQLQKTVVNILKLIVDINSRKLDQLLRRVNVVDEMFELRRAHPDKVKEYNALWLMWAKRNYRKRLNSFDTASNTNGM